MGIQVETGETELKTVTKVYVHSVDEILHLYTDEGDIDTTTNHPFYVIGKGWVAAGDLAVGDEIYNLDGTTSTILGSEIEVLDEPILVYNLEVEDFHSYFVGCVPVLVHNYVDTDHVPFGGDYIASDGTVYSGDKNYKITDPNSRDWMEIHNVGRPHNGWLPHTHFPIHDTRPDGTKIPRRDTKQTTYGDYDLLHYAITVLGWILE